MRWFALLASLAVAFAADEVGSKACAGCHAAIYQRYTKSGMATTSGKVGSGTFRESFLNAAPVDAVSGASYRVSAAASGYRMEFSRQDVKGQRTLTYFVGSGKIGRSYLFAQGGYLFQAPVSYYSLAKKWNISPGYERRPNVDLTRVVETACLRCHASRLQPVSGVQNRFEAEPFLEAGISCERCHGPGKQHIAAAGKGQIVNPAKLRPLERDSVCAQCHLTGAARVARHTDALYQPGRPISDNMASFVWSDRSLSILSATSHFEKLEQSTCKRASGDKLWCGSCHDPHGSPAAVQKMAYYRRRCLECHQTKPCSETETAQARVGNDCTSCHMSKGVGRSVEHTVFTDHAIPRRPSQASTTSTERILRPFWPSMAGNRELGLAYAVVAADDKDLQRTATGLLESVTDKDATVLAQLAQLHGETPRSAELAEQALRADPTLAGAAANLGVHKARAGDIREAIRLWEHALSMQPALTAVSLNLAVAHYRNGNRAAAEAALQKAVEFDPDNQVVRRMLADLNRSP
jgi:predicted CXXCH cytochrome family protein